MSTPQEKAQCVSWFIKTKSDIQAQRNFIVYRTKVRDINDLHHRIIEAINTVTEDMLARIWQEIEYLLDIVRATDGAHVEVYQSISRKLEAFTLTVKQTDRKYLKNKTMVNFLNCNDNLWTPCITICE